MNKQRTRLKLAKMAALLLCIGAVGCGKKSTQQVPEAKVEKGVFYIDIYEEGDRKSVV